jgi:isopentenyl diphosphate isomerase/L-lactate dehydrogenase-like FMN-dependent dehydrogenase
MQLYLYRTREYAARLVERVDRAGLEALIVTTDSNLFGNREWDRRNYARPLQLNLRNMFDVLCHPRWLFDVLIPHGVPRFKNLGTFCRRDRILRAERHPPSQKNSIRRSAGRISGGCASAPHSAASSASSTVSIPFTISVRGHSPR